METHNIKILTIDDSQDNLTVLKAVIADNMPEALVLSAYNGAEGLALARKEIPDVILLDILMPDMDGYEVCRLMKQDAKLHSIPVIFLTALGTDRESHIKAIEAGGECFLAKPVHEIELTAQIRAMIKIRHANLMQQRENESLSALVAQRTITLEKELAERKAAEKQVRFAHSVLDSLNHRKSAADTISGILQMVKSDTGIEAVAIRLSNETDFPYYAAEGFSESFISHARTLCTYDQYGHIQRDAEGKPVLRCICGAILQGKIDIAQPCFTKGGSFWINSSSKWLAALPETQQQKHTGALCIYRGYESMALIPLRSDNKIIGLLQLNDHRPDQFTLKMIEFYEGLGASVGIAITRKQAEDELKKTTTRALELAMQAEAANEAKNQFLANMSHELLTPLNGVLGIASILQDTALDPAQQSYVNIIRDSGQTLLSLIKNIMDFSNTTTGTIKLVRSDFFMRAFLNDFAASVARKAHNNNLQFSYAVASDVPLEFHGDTGKLRQILTNLADNAIKFTDKGEISFTVSMIRQCDDIAHVEYAIRDTGIGIPADKMNKLFKGFSQVDGSSTRRHGGAGLGLAITKQLVTLMGGEINIESKPDQGTTVRVIIPLAIRHQIQPKPADHAIEPLNKSIPMPGNRKRVLVVEDNKTNQAVAMILLKKIGLDAVGAGNGAEALAALSDAHFDLILMDIQMPIMDGLEATRRIRENEKATKKDHHDPDGARAIPIIALTAHTQDGDRDCCLDAGMNDYITKPISHAQLVEMVTKWLPQTTVNS